MKGTTALSLHIGLNQVNAAHYGGTYPLSGCHNDARDMQAIARASGYEATTLLDANATAARILQQIAHAVGRLRSGDTFLLTYAGHGAQVADETGDETDSLDETWVVFDRMLLDDEIYASLAGFMTGVRVLVISDSCHSGSVARLVQYEKLMREGPIAPVYAGTTARFRTPEADFGTRVWKQHAGEYNRIARAVPGNQRTLVRAAVIQISGCQDDQLSADGVGNGLFTSKLKEVWASGHFCGDHRDFGRSIRVLMPPTQSPNYLTFGGGVTDFEKEKPFSVRKASASTAGHAEQGSDHMNVLLNDEGNWLEVRAELERKFPGWRPPTDGGVAWSGSYPGSRAASGPPIVRAFWWGFHIECSSQGLRDFLSVADPVNSIAAAIGPVTGPAAPFVLAAAAAIAGMLQLLRNIDRGNGVYISMSWFAPGIFIPTTVPTRGVQLTGSRGPQFKPLPFTDINGDIFRITGTYSEEPGAKSNSFTLRVTNTSGKWVDVVIDRAGGQGVMKTGHIMDGESGGFTESLQIYENGRNKITRWRPGVFEVPGNGGGEIFFAVPDDAVDVVIDLEVIG